MTTPKFNTAFDLKLAKLGPGVSIMTTTATPTPAPQAAEQQGEALHTPGPWSLVGATLIWSIGHGLVALAAEPEGRRSDDFKPVDIGSDRFDEACANAALIARAWEIPALESRLAEAQGLIREMAQEMHAAIMGIGLSHQTERKWFALLQRAKQALEVRG